jgi:outer membrane protein OmpA-like peptidoglycan-associated protein
MTSKKQTILLALLCLVGFSAMSQVGVSQGIYNYYDSSLIPKSRLAEHQQFLNQVSAYPAKPRNQWEVGAGVGMFTVSGDVPAVLPTGGFTVHVRKSIGYLFSLRLQYLYGVGKGLHWLEANNYEKNPAWNQAGADYNGHFLLNGAIVPGTGQPGIVAQRLLRQSSERVYYNYRTNVQDLGLQGVLTLNNVRFHKKKTGLVLYGVAGIGASIYETKVDARNASGGKYTFTQTSATHPTRKSLLSSLKSQLDGTYETLADNHGNRRPKLFGKTLKPSGTVGVGAAWRLSRLINLSLEDRHTFIKDDLLDGQRWQEHATGDAAMTRDFDSYNMLTLGLNVNLGAKAVEPLWWLNPLDYAYTELPKATAAKFKYSPKDGDGDGVQDELDKEPNTPAGCPVNTQGVTADTDGDGVPDCKDKELITPTQCQPVDADGIGKCPEPECCKNGGGTGGTDGSSCNFSAPAVEFANGSCNLSSDAKDALNTLASDMKANAGCSVTVTARGESKATQRLADCRANAIRKYLVSKGVSESRINTAVDQTSDSNTADIEVSGGM